MQKIYHKEQNMELGISTACFYPMYTENAIEEIGRLNIKNIEIFINSESEFSSGYIDEIRRRIEFYGMKVVSVHPYTSGTEGVAFFSGYERRLDDSLDKYARYFDAANILGAKYFTFHGERRIASKVKVDSVPGEKIAAAYKRLNARAKDCGIILAQENVAWCKSSDLEYLTFIRDMVPELHFTLDTKQAVRAGVDVNEYLKIMGDRTVNVHISDHDSANMCLLPGEGDMDYDKFIDGLKNVGYDGHLLVEVYASDYDNMSQITGSFEFLKQRI